MFKIKLLVINLTLFLSMSVFGQQQLLIEKLDIKSLPKGIEYEGKIIKAVRWADGLGDNIIILSESGIHQNKKFKHENDGNDAELFAYHYLIENGTATKKWRIYDFIADCPVDIMAKFFIDSFQITDLNKDGINEVWIMYKIGCHGDVSPSDMKIIMYQGVQKFAVRGQNKVFNGTDNKGTKKYSGGEFKFDKAFTEGPKEFMLFAKKLWNKNIMQKWD